MTGIAPLPGLGTLRISGSDAKRFLHGQCTQDVVARLPGEGGYAFLLDARGKNLGDFRFVVRPDAILCTLDRSRVAEAKAWLERFVIAADVRIEDVSERRSALLVAGAGAPDALRAVLGANPPELEDHATTTVLGGQELLVVGDRSFGEPGFDVWASSDAASALSALADELARRGAKSLEPQALEPLRIEAGRPVFGVDLDETVLPFESGQDDRAVSYTKGCYSGQEVVAKQKYLGKPRKMLCGVFLSGAVPRATALVGWDGAEAGRVTSCAFSPGLRRHVGLAMIKAPVPAPGSALATAASGTHAEVASLPFNPDYSRR